MDTFFEQIVSIKKTGKSLALLAGIWFAAMLLIVLIMTVGIGLLGLSPLPIFLAIGVIYGAIKLSSRLSIEYEYIVTNGSLDVDKIIARSSRKRELSCEISGIERVEKFNPAAPPVGNFKKTVMACDANDPNAYFVVVSEEGKGTRLLVFAPDERIRGAIVKSLPKFIANSAFK